MAQVGSESALEGSWRAESANGKDEAAAAAAGGSAAVAKAMLAVALTRATEGKWMLLPWFSRLERRGFEEAWTEREGRERERGGGGIIDAMAIEGTASWSCLTSQSDNTRVAVNFSPVWLELDGSYSTESCPIRISIFFIKYQGDPEFSLEER